MNPSIAPFPSGIQEIIDRGESYREISSRFGGFRNRRPFLVVVNGAGEPGLPSISIDDRTGRILLSWQGDSDVIGFFYPPGLAILQDPGSCPPIEIAGVQSSPIHYAELALERRGLKVSTLGVAPPTSYLAGLPSRKQFFIDWLEVNGGVHRAKPGDIDFHALRQSTSLYRNVRRRKPQRRMAAL